VLSNAVGEGWLISVQELLLLLLPPILPVESGGGRGGGGVGRLVGEWPSGDAVPASVKLLR
jgi:hypothetical protein